MIPKDIQCSIRGTKKCNDVISDNIKRISKKAKLVVGLNEDNGGQHSATMNRLLYDIDQLLAHMDEAMGNSFRHTKAKEQSLEHAWNIINEAQIAE